MKPEIKMALRRWILRKLRIWFDALDERLHGAEIRIRLELAAERERKEAVAGFAGELHARTVGASNSLAGYQSVTPARSKAPAEGGSPARESFSAWEMRRAGITVKPKPRRRRGVSSAEFSDRFASQVEAAR